MTLNYFSLLSIPETFEIDPAQLEAAYFREQRNFHPDRFVGKSGPERQQAAQRSVDINQAYQTLKAPLSRAQYMLAGQGIMVGGDKDSVKPSQALLIEIMELRERIEEISGSQMNELVGSLDAMYDASVAKIANAFRQKLWQDMAQETLRLGYIVKTSEDIKRKKKAS